MEWSTNCLQADIKWFKYHVFRYLYTVMKFVPYLYIIFCQYLGIVAHLYLLVVVWCEYLPNETGLEPRADARKLSSKSDAVVQKLLKFRFKETNALQASGNENLNRGMLSSLGLRIDGLWMCERSRTSRPVKLSLCMNTTYWPKNEAIKIKIQVRNHKGTRTSSWVCLEFIITPKNFRHLS